MALLSPIIGAIWPYLAALGVAVAAFFAGHQQGRKVEQVKQAQRGESAAVAKVKAMKQTEDASDAQLVDDLVAGPGTE